MSNDKILESIKKCESVKTLRGFIRNARHADLTVSSDIIFANTVLIAARDRLWEVSAASHEPQSPIERALRIALYAYEWILSEEKNKTIYARRIRSRINEVGIILAIQKSVLRGNTSGLNVLKAMNRLDASFEAVILKYPNEFPNDVVTAAKRNLQL